MMKRRVWMWRQGRWVEATTPAARKIAAWPYELGSLNSNRSTRWFPVCVEKHWAVRLWLGSAQLIILGVVCIILDLLAGLAGGR